MHQICT